MNEKKRYALHNIAGVERQSGGTPTQSDLLKLDQAGDKTATVSDCEGGGGEVKLVGPFFQGYVSFIFLFLRPNFGEVSFLPLCDTCPRIAGLGRLPPPSCYLRDPAHLPYF